MIQITPHMNILVAIAPVDFRKGIDGLAALCRHYLNVDPFSGTLFVFTNKSRKALRIVSYDGQGFWMCHKRLSTGRFKWEFQSDGGKASSL
ncbi:MAG: IS66 family insertion sequence element accessory protein TnpB, partial [Pseudomonadota bacterium]